MPDELETILRLVAEGRLTPDEAAPIIEAITRAEREDASSDDPFDDPIDDRFHRRIERGVERANRRIARATARVESARARAEAAFAGTGAGADLPAGARHLRIRVTERGRQVVNLRIPIGFVEGALRFVPGIGGEQEDRIREAVRSGVIGPIIDVEDPDGSGGVLISVE